MDKFVKAAVKMPSTQRTMTYRSKLDELTEMAKNYSYDVSGIALGEEFYIELLRLKIKDFRTGKISAEQLKKEKKRLERKLLGYWRDGKLFAHACKVRNAQSMLLVEAEKHGCPICKKLVRIFDGREK